MAASTYPNGCVDLSYWLRRLVYLSEKDCVDVPCGCVDTMNMKNLKFC